MIFILSEESDPSTNNVIKWLKYYNKKYIRVNDVDKIDLSRCCVTNTKQNFELIITTKNSTETIRISSDKITAYWYRRGNIRLVENGINKKRLIEATTFIQEQIRDVENYLLYKLAAKTSVNKLSDVFINKIIAIDVAVSVGLKIPNTTITKNGDYVKNELLYKTPTITKGFKEGVINLLNMVC